MTKENRYGFDHTAGQAPGKRCAAGNQQSGIYPGTDYRSA